MPLILDSTGKKFGKSEGNALWLDKEKTSPYKIYQYLINSDDSKVVEYLKVFTFLSKEEIDKLEESVKNEPEKRLAQKALAFEVVKDLHGEEEAIKARNTSEELFTKGYSEEGMEEVLIDMDDEINILDLLVKSTIAPSKSEARRLVQGNGISINNEKENLEYYYKTCCSCVPCIHLVSSNCMAVCDFAFNGKRCKWKKFLPKALDACKLQPVVLPYGYSSELPGVV